MSIVKIEMYTAKCDNCGDYHDGEEYSAWVSDESAKEAVEHDEGWLENGESHYCCNCFLGIDSDNNLIIKKV